ncbi:hypothetical protein N7512_006394 [Penicillium capsulatum]|nr:hypothetical protein N7512_006394 [Penicillium capsulatum]
MHRVVDSCLTAPFRNENVTESVEDSIGAEPMIVLVGYTDSSRSLLLSRGECRRARLKTIHEPSQAHETYAQLQGDEGPWNSLV